MTKISKRTGLMTSSALLGAAICTLSTVPGAAFAQEAVNAPAAEHETVSEVVVTGSRIRRVSTETDAPVSVVNQADLLERGYTQVGEAVTKMTSVTLPTPSTFGNAAAAGDGRQYPNLFNLGAGRTLSLVNGRRTASSSNGLGDRVTDTNLIPTGLLDHVDVVQAGGAAVYGSDAIAGVINYVLKQDFDGLVIDAQYGNTTRNDYARPALRVTAGRNFAEGRANIAGNFEYAKSEPIYSGSRKITQPIVRQLGNPYNVNATDGVPSLTPVPNAHFWGYNEFGVVSPVSSQNANAPPTLQFSTDGATLRPFNPGTSYAPPFPCAVPFCVGGDGYDYGRHFALQSGVETFSGTVIGHYDVSDSLKVSAELLYARNRGVDPLGFQAPQKILGGGANAGAIPFNRNNPYLTPAVVSALDAAYPTFASGGALFLSKNFEDGDLASREVVYTADTYRALFALDGDFNAVGRDFYYNAFYSLSRVKGKTKGYGIMADRFDNALNAVRNTAGQIVCGVNADTITTNDDPLCAPVNPFGKGNISNAARAYVVAASDSIYTNTQHDFLASLGGDVVKLPAGAAKFNISYEHRVEEARNTPSAVSQLGLIGTKSVTLPTFGRFNTDELAGELLVPLIGGGFKPLPFVEAWDLSGQYRFVDNSLAGKESVWGASSSLQLALGLTVRGSVSRNFRAPTLNQILAPQTVALGSGIQDPCDARVINAGPNPSVRQANCQALFAANPGWGPLANYQNTSFNQNTALITSGGNPNLENEVSKTKTIGFVWQPKFVPGNLTVVADRVVVDLKNGLTAFTPTNFAQGCFDATPQPADLCSTFTRDPASGSIVTALNVTFNAAKVAYRGDVINVNYRFPVSWLLPMFDDPGHLELGVEATHNESLKTVVAGVATQTAGTTQAARWITRSTARYTRGPLAVSYEYYYLPKTKVNVFDSIETTAYPIVASNGRHSISASYKISDAYQVRVGVNNLTNVGPSFPSYSYGDLVGRQWFIGLRGAF